MWLSNLARQRSTFGMERRKVCGVRQARPARQVRLGPAQRGEDSCGSHGDQVRRRLRDGREGQDEAALPSLFFVLARAAEFFPPFAPLSRGLVTLAGALQAAEDFG